jgi:protein gp37
MPINANVSQSTAISWTNQTWNPVTGCSKVSAGCDNCYAERLALQYGWTQKPWTGENAVENVVLKPHKLREPYKVKQASRIFVNSMSDCFHPQVPDEYLVQMFAVMNDLPQHVFQVLTKRPWNAVAWWRRTRPVWPRNLWIGTSTEDQRAADERVPYLLQLPAAVRFLSCEPLLGKVDLRLWLNDESEDVADDSFHRANADDVQAARGIQWVIVGGESGRNARDMSPGWAALILEDCRVANVPVFMKQMGSVWAEVNGAAHKKGGDPNEWAPAFRVQEFPDVRDV